MSENAETIRASFSVPARSYDLLMGRYLPTLAPAFADEARVRTDMTALDVGCGPGGLTAELIRRVGADRVAAIDPSEPFVQACRMANPGADVRVGVAERLPFADASFDTALACLVVGFMSEATAGIREMARVTKPGGVVAACFWNYERMPLINTFFRAAAEIHPGQQSEASRFGTRRGEIAALLGEAGLTDVRESELAATARYSGFDDWWSPMPLGVGPPGAFYRSIDAAAREVLRARCFELLGSPSGAFELTADAWCACGTV
jgi:SAM-dependent methyltransferase